MLNALIIIAGKIFSKTSKILNIGHGSTWPGHIALFFNSNFIEDVLEKNFNLKVILVAGTNGKTTTGRLVQEILEKSGKRVFQNESGANLLNGIASSIILHSGIFCVINYDYAIFEIDENNLPLILEKTIPNFIILLNLFRDQLDRYGEINQIAKKWTVSLSKLPKTTMILLNADDPQIAYLGENINNAIYFGIESKNSNYSKPEHASDSTYCPNCTAKLRYKNVYFSHLGDWECATCGLRRPRVGQNNSPFYPLAGTHNKYNTHAAVLLAREIGIDEKMIEKALKNFRPAFGRQEKINFNGKQIQVFLSKNPTSFNESLRTVKELKGKYLLLILNDRIPDGRDISWIWDIDTEELNPVSNVILSGDRVYDMALRIKYSSKKKINNEKLTMKNYNVIKFRIIKNMKEAIDNGLKELRGNEILYILPTYSAMLEVRQILTDKKIL